ncbi:hypothetical protein L202_01060 [Cryptococcus amylolentus CBS 6039]|uniref:Major facilitator superfamily (MFS) profile domain-containing protein n=2 Tax=Cryptococcus amylolentus TaxID=104669 RepID=A0A1E3I2G3_9TREE|nr:hypothetical protein L202_01060 [Cryptococcus amylolentus CBS 6039]ODN82784.1 hypothetical protein L202_01060 [Cryptococcus amylolentus CBS 6039]
MPTESRHHSDADIVVSTTASSSTTLMSLASSTPKTGEEHKLKSSNSSLQSNLGGPSRRASQGDVQNASLDDGILDAPPDRSSRCSKSGEGEGPGNATEVEMIDGRPKDVYDRFTKRQKYMIVAIISYSAFIGPMTSSIFLPSIPVMSTDLHSSTEVINYTVAIFLVSIGVAPIFWSPFAGFYGRKPVYLASMPIMVVASVGVANSKNIGALIGTRILQGIGSSSVLSVGAGTIGDIFRPTERSSGMAMFYMGVLIGPTLSPIIGGLFTEYTAITWRAAQYFLVGCSALSVALTLFFLPETAHPPTMHEKLKKETGKKFVPYFVNPVGSLLLLRWPNIAMACVISSCIMLDTYCVIVPLSAVFKERYHINNSAIAGCLYLANGVGNMISSKLAGPFADGIVKKYIAKRGYRRPEDRLKASFWGLALGMPVSILIYGWVLKFGKGGMAPPLIMVFLNGLSLMLALTPINTYLVDAMQSRSAEVIAVNNCIRYIFSAAASAFIVPLANAIGWGWTMTICSFVAWGAAVALFFLIRYGEVWREAANLRYGVTRREADEEKADEGKDEEAAVRGRDESTVERVDEKDKRSSSVEEDGEHGEHPVDLERTFTRPAGGARGGKGSGSGYGSGAGGAGLQRQGSRKAGEAPGMDDVLKRQVSLSGGSIHGGG